MDTAHEALKLHVVGLARPTGPCVASLKSFTESENMRPSLTHQPERTSEIGSTLRITTRAGLAGIPTLGVFLFQNAVTGIEFAIVTGHTGDPRQA